MRELPDRSLRFWRWTLACGLAELLGIGAAALWWVMLDRLEPEPRTLLACMVMLLGKGLSGLFEGTILGLIQGALLRLRYPRLSVRGWIAATCALAVLGWLLGSAPSIFLPQQAGSPDFDPSLTLTIALASVSGALVGVLFGAAQWLVLRHAASRASLWIWANASAWAVALPLIYIAASTGPAEPSTLQVALRGVVGGLGAGLLLGAVQYPFLMHIDPRPRSRVRTH